MKNLYELSFSELIKMYDIVLHNRGILSDEFFVADLIRSEILRRLMPDALNLKEEQK